jgi:hypothetical protein
MKRKKAQLYLRHKNFNIANLDPIFSESRSGTIANKNQKRIMAAPIIRVASHLFTGSLAGIGKLPALASWYVRYGMYGIFCTVRFGGSFIL